MHRTRSVALGVVATLAILPAAARCADGSTPQVTVQLDPHVVGVGEPAELRFETSGDGNFTPHFQLDNLQVVGGPSRQQSFSMVNGQMSSSFALSWYVSPQKVGQALVHDIKVTLGKQEISLPDQKLEVSQQAQHPARRRGNDPFSNDPFFSRSPFDDPMFRDFFGNRRAAQPVQVAPPQIELRAEAQPANPYQGQQVLYTLYLLVEQRRPGTGRVQVESIYPRQMPKFKGFWSQQVQLPKQMQPESVTVSGKHFWRQPVLRYALFPYRNGRQPIDAATLDLHLIYFQPTVFGEQPTRPSPETKSSQRLDLAVRPLPAAPAGFSGAVGHFTWQADLTPRAVDTGSAATLTIKLAGNGQINGVVDPQLPALRGIKVFPPEKDSSHEVQGTHILHRRSWSFALVPSRPGSWHLAPLQWTYFDPKTGSYETLHTSALDLRAKGATLAGTSPLPTTAEETSAPTPPAPQLAADKSTTPTPQAASKALAAWQDHSWLPLLALLLLAAVATAAALRWGPRRPAAARDLLSQLRHARSQRQPRQIAAAAEEAWRSFLACRWQVPAGVPCHQWPQRLEEQGVDRDTAGHLVRLMDDLHYLRYSPQLASTEALQDELWQRSRRLLRRLR